MTQAEQTKLQQVQQKLQETEFALQEILASSGILYFTYYPLRHLYEVSVLPKDLDQIPASMDNFPEALMEYARFSATDKKNYRDMVDKIDKGAPEAECYCHFYYNHKYTWYKVHLHSIYDKNGKVVRAIGSALNVDQQKKAEASLAEERLRMSSLSGSDVLSVSCFSVTYDKPIQFPAATDSKAGESQPVTPLLSPAQELELLAEAQAIDPRILQQNQVTRTSLFAAAQNIPDAQQRKQFIKSCSHTGMQEAFANGTREFILEYRRHTNRGLIWVRTRAALLADPHNRDVLAFYYTTDINEQRIRQAVMTRLVSSGFDTAAYTDLKNHQLYVLNVQPHADRHIAAVTEYEATVAKYLPLLVHPDDLAKCRKEFTLDFLQEKLRRLPSYSIYYRALPAQKSETAGTTGTEPGYRSICMRIFYLNEEQQYLVFGRSDITDQVELEENRNALLETSLRKAEAANIAKSTFLARMSHDIRTPLNGILGMTGLALDEEPPVTTRYYLQKINESGHFLLALINDILDMSKVESGKMELHPEPYSYRELQSYLEAVIIPLCATKNIHFTILNSYDKYCVLVDKVRLNQIFFNLLSNAVKFTPKGGQVWLEFKNYHIADAYLSLDISVRDNGIGISKEFQSKLFMPFEQEYTAKSAPRLGSGLGLSIVKSLVDLMGGTIALRSVKNQGTEFTLHLAFPIVPEAKPLPVKSLPVYLQGKCFLIAEDNAINAEIVLRLLQKKGAATSIAATGLDALNQFVDSEQYHFDAILMDVQMPVLDGLEATRKIRVLPRPDAQAVPIIAMTANAYTEDVEACLAAGMNAHVAKPLEPAKLFATLAQQLQLTASP